MTSHFYGRNVYNMVQFKEDRSVEVKPVVLPLRDHQMPVRSGVAGLN
jgi:hypothetical protein